ncbi:hypothetical protein LCE31_20625 [Streptomyces sp. 8L]|nr:hypothetical protein [Streptomyces sp. 8L]MCA1220762.1 hypothetical protein [Streptomyces sp. 8L]
MARRPLPRILSSGTTRLTRGREMARTAADGATDVLHPLITLTRGLRLLAVSARQKWAGTPRERRGPALFLVAACGLVVALMPYGPLLALGTVMALAAWKGHAPAPRRTGPDDAEVRRLQSLYEALVPYLSVPEDPSPLFAHGGEWTSAFDGHAFDDEGRLTRLTVSYPPYFTDGDPVARATVEQLLHAKSGRGREYHFAWDQEGNQLVMRVLPALSTSIAAQRFVTVPGETVLGFTDDTSVRRTLPVVADGETLQEPPVVWRTGPRSTEPHLLVAGRPGAGATSLLRSIALQALQHGDVVIVEGSGTGEFAAFADRAGVLAVESDLSGALAALEWAAHETERRLIAANRARQAGTPLPDDVKRPLWILLDRPSVFAHLAAADGRRDPQQLLAVPLRHGRAAGVSVVVAEHSDALDWIDRTVTSHTLARVALGALPAELVESVLGAPPHTTPTPDVPPGRGYARLGGGEVLRVQVPATPDPYDAAAQDGARQAVLEMLPRRRGEPESRERDEALDQAADRTRPVELDKPVRLEEPVDLEEPLDLDEPREQEGPLGQAGLAGQAEPLEWHRPPAPAPGPPPEHAPEPAGRTWSATGTGPAPAAHTVLGAAVTPPSPAGAAAHDDAAAQATERAPEPWPCPETRPHAAPAGHVSVLNPVAAEG